jgi:hypothetical protein
MFQEEWITASKADLLRSRRALFILTIAVILDVSSVYYVVYYVAQ